MNSTATAVRQPRPTLTSLTGIRFIAAFVVALFHANVTLATFDPSRNRSFTSLSHGYIGVSLFFVLSGFIITYTYIQGDNTLRGTRAAFWRARFARVYPVYLVALLVACPLFVKGLLAIPFWEKRYVHVALAGILSPVLLQAWWPTTACQWNCVGWSLSVEMLFYAVFPVLGVWLACQSVKISRAAVIGVWLASLAIPILYLVLRPDGLSVVQETTKTFWVLGLKYNPIVHLGEFAIGIGSGLLFLRRPSGATSLGWSALAIVALIVIMGSLAFEGTIPYPLLHSGLLAPAFAVLIYVLACHDAQGYRGWLGAPLMFKLGECSYAFYLLHLSIISYFVIAARAMHLHGAAIYGVLLASLVTGVLVSVIVFERIEEPARRWIRDRTVVRRSMDIPSISILDS